MTFHPRFWGPLWSACRPQSAKTCTHGVSAAVRAHPPPLAPRPILRHSLQAPSSLWAAISHSPSLSIRLQLTGVDFGTHPRRFSMPGAVDARRPNTGPHHEVTVDHARKNLDHVPAKNETRLVGVVREDPKVRELRGGRAMTTISIATTTIANGRPREDWHGVTAWGNTGVAAQEIKAGDTLEVVGALPHRMIGEEGTKRKLSVIECQRFQVLERAQTLQVAPEVRPRAQGRRPRTVVWTMSPELKS